LTTLQSLIDKYLDQMRKAGTDLSEIANLYSEFVLQLQKLSSPIEKIRLILQKIAKDPCMEEANFWLNAAQEHPSLAYLESLCSILSTEKSCIWYEVVIQILAELKDEQAIPALEKALDYDFDTDAWNRIGIECINALAEISTEKAINVIRKAATSPIERIKEEAKLTLEDLGED
jgi:HEAT repeat protein